MLCYYRKDLFDSVVTSLLTPKTTGPPAKEEEEEECREVDPTPDSTRGGEYVDESPGESVYRKPTLFSPSSEFTDFTDDCSDNDDEEEVDPLSIE